MNGRGTVIAVVVACGLGLALVACGGPWLPVATAIDATRASARWPETTVDQLNRGRTLLVRRCGNCHQPPSPAARTADRWPADVADMAARAGLRTGERELINRYLAAFARDQVTR